MALINKYKCPPGQFWYRQTEGIERRFEATPLIDSLAIEVADFREGNKLARATKDEAYSDIEEFTCARLKYDKQWCYDPSAPLVTAQPVQMAASQPKVRTLSSTSQVALQPAQKPNGCPTCGARVKR